MFIIIGFIIIRINSQDISKSSMFISKLTNYSIIFIISLNFLRFFFTILFFSKEILILNLLKINLLRVVGFYLILRLTLFYTFRILICLIQNFSGQKILIKKIFNFDFSKVTYMVVIIFFRFI